MIRKYGKILIVLFILCTILLPVGMASAKSEKHNVYDDSGVLTDGDIQGLIAKITEVQKNKKIDIAYIIVAGDKHTNATDLHNLGTVLYEAGTFGVNKTKDTAILMVSIVSRKFTVLRFGSDKFRDNMDKYFSDIKEQFVYELKSNNYNKAGLRFIDAVAKYSTIGYFGKVLKLMFSWITPLIGLILSGIIVFAVLSTHKGTIDVNEITYEQDGSYHLTERDDMFRYSTVSTRAKTKSSSGSSSGGGSNSSGGGSY